MHADQVKDISAPQMEDIVKRDPVVPVGEAIREVKLKIASEIGTDNEVFMSVIDALGSTHALEQRLLRVRISFIGTTPRSRFQY